MTRTTCVNCLSLRTRRRGVTVVPSQAHLTDEGQLYYFNPVTVKSQVRPRAVVIVIG